MYAAEFSGKFLRLREVTALGRIHDRYRANRKTAEGSLAVIWPRLLHIDGSGRAPEGPEYFR